VLVFILRNTHTHAHKQIKQQEEKRNLAAEHRAVRQVEEERKT